jgi:hypothetical protein
MALKADRDIVTTDITFVLKAAAAAGKIVCYKTVGGSGAGSGVGIGDYAGEVTVVSGTPASGTRPAGLLLNEFVNIDQTVQHRNYQKVQQVVGEPATLLRNGWVVSDQVTGTPAAGDPAYLGASGVLSPTQTNSIPAVGEFMSVKDSNGFARVYIKLT